MSDCSIDWQIVLEALKTFSAVISWLLVIAGWFFVSRDHNRRENRKEIRAVVNQIEALVRNIEETAHHYYLKSGADPEISSISLKIRRDIKRLGGDLARLRSICDAIDCKSEMIFFRQTITGGDFDVKRRAATASNSTKLADISGAADDLLTSLEQGFTRRFLTA